MTAAGEYVQSKNKPKEIRERIAQMRKLPAKDMDNGQNPAIKKH